MSIIVLSVIDYIAQNASEVLTFSLSVLGMLLLVSYCFWNKSTRLARFCCYIGVVGLIMLLVCGIAAGVWSIWFSGNDIKGKIITSNDDKQWGAFYEDGEAVKEVPLEIKRGTSRVDTINVAFNPLNIMDSPLDAEISREDSSKVIVKRGTSPQGYIPLDILRNINAFDLPSTVTFSGSVQVGDTITVDQSSALRRFFDIPPIVVKKLKHDREYQAQGVVVEIHHRGKDPLEALETRDVTRETPIVSIKGDQWQTRMFLLSLDFRNVPGKARFVFIKSRY